MSLKYSFLQLKKDQGKRILLLKLLVILNNGLKSHNLHYLFPEKKMHELKGSRAINRRENSPRKVLLLVRESNTDL